MTYPGGGAFDPGKDPGKNLSGETRGALGLLVVAGGVVLAVLTAALWDDDVPFLLLAAMVLMSVMALGLGIYGIVRRND